MEYLRGGVSTDLDNAFQTDSTNGQIILSEWADINAKNVITNDSSNSPFNATPGDIIVITVKSIGSANVKSSASLYFSEEI